MPISASDGLSADVVARAQQGDAAARAAFARDCYARAYRWALSYTGAPDDAEDIAQHVTIRAYDKLETFQFAARVTTWLFQLTRRTLADRFRTERRRRSLLLQHPPVLVRDETRTLELKLLADLVKQQLGSLPARQREVFDLVDVQGFATTEVAEYLGLEESTVRVHLLRARRAIRARVLEPHASQLQGVINEL